MQRRCNKHTASYDAALVCLSSGSHRTGSRNRLTSTPQRVSQRRLLGRRCPGCKLTAYPPGACRRGTWERGAMAGLSTDQELIDYISKGPLASSCGLASSAVKEDLAQWKRLGDFLIKNLGFPARAQLSDVQRLRIFWYYLPVFFWCRGQLEHHKGAVASKEQPKRPLVVGMQAPQGCGKTTLVEELEALFEHEGVRTASVSIDDFYLTFADQQALARANPGNRLLQVRGNAGTHDVALGGATLRALAAAEGSDTAPRAAVAVPRYDKSAHAGRGDRAPPGKWPRVKGPVKLVLFEGWMLGFRPVGAAAVAEVDADLVPIDAALRGYEAAWDSHVDAWLVIKVHTPDWVYRWRLEAEHAMRASGRPGMTDKQVEDFVDRYMPAYHAYLPGMYARGPSTARSGHVLVVEINETRSLAAEQPGPFHEGDNGPGEPSRKGPGPTPAHPGAPDASAQDRNSDADRNAEAPKADGREAARDAGGQWQRGEAAFEREGKSVVAAWLGLYVFASFALDCISRQRVFS